MPSPPCCSLTRLFFGPVGTQGFEDLHFRRRPPPAPVLAATCDRHFLRNCWSGFRMLSALGRGRELIYVTLRSNCSPRNTENHNSVPSTTTSTCHTVAKYSACISYQTRAPGTWRAFLLKLSYRAISTATYKAFKSQLQ